MGSPRSPAYTMEICESGEAFVMKDGDLEFDHTKLIRRQGDNYSYARIPERVDQVSTVDIERLEKVEISVESVWPPTDPRFTPAPDPLPPNAYLKQPSLLFYGDTPASREPGLEILAEVEAFEVLRLNPHPNIARYLGCVSKGGRITGLCFVRYPITLSRLLSDGASFDRPHCLQGIEAAVAHIHKLGLVHNDLNPSNIMMDGDVSILIDFDSCKSEGEPLGVKGGTVGWALENAAYSKKENDFYGLSKLRGLLLGEATN